MQDRGTKAKAMRTSQIGPLWRIASTRMPTKWGMFEAIGFERDVSNGRQRVETALAIVLGDPTEGVPLLRIHSQCFTGELLGSLRCDCGDQLAMAMQAIAEEGRGLVIYEYQEGRGIGLISNNPRKASALAQNGVELVVHLSCEAAPTEHSSAYLRTKKERMGHVLNLR